MQKAANVLGVISEKSNISIKVSRMVAIITPTQNICKSKITPMNRSGAFQKAGGPLVFTWPLRAKRRNR